MDKMLTLLTLQRQALEAESIASLAHVIVNETVKLVPYQQAIFWLGDGDTIRLHTASGNTSLDENSPAMQTLKADIGRALATRNKDEHYPHLLALNREGKQKPKSLLMVLETGEDGIMGGVYMERGKAFQDGEQQILSELAFAYAQALAVKTLRGRTLMQQAKSWFPKIKIPLTIAALVIFLWPVRLTITAPAEIIAQNPTIITAPFQGTLESIEISPGDAVSVGDALAKMERLTLSSQVENARQELDIARQRLAQLRREVLSDADKKQDLRTLESDIALKQIEYDYAANRLERSVIRTPRDGIAIYADKNSLQGKPLQTGDTIMTIADPLQSELLIRVPADAMIPLKTNTDIRFFLNVAPLQGYDAAIKSIGYQASADPDGLLSYKIYARLDETVQNIRIGWKGTAKIYGDRVIFGYALLRRPLVMLRNLFGV